MVHLSDLDWNRPGEQVIDEFKKGDVVRAQVLDVDVEKERISLGIKQLAGDPSPMPVTASAKNQVVTCEVLEVKDRASRSRFVDSDLQAFIRRDDLARERNDQRPERFAAGEKLDARVTQFDRKARRVQLSIKALEMAEEKEAIAQFGSADSGASLGDILGAALKARQADKKLRDPSGPRRPGHPSTIRTPAREQPSARASSCRHSPERGGGCRHPALAAARRPG